MVSVELVELKEQLGEVMDKQFIKPSICIGYSSLLVKKKDGSRRLCVDALNRKILHFSQ